MNKPGEVAPVHKYGIDTREDPTADAMRRERCLCLHCVRLKPGDVLNCSSAEVLFALCKTRGMAMVVTRCMDYKQKP